MASSKPSLPPLPQLVRERADYLLALAAATVQTDEKRAIRYVDLAVRLASRHRLPLGRARKRLFCANCHRPWVAGYNLRIRLRPRTRRAEYTCSCGKSRFFAYSVRKPKTAVSSSSPAGGKLVRQPFKRNWC
ncbi:MAG: hypothetical protein KGH63_02490 [Candidatus Micrarchaeota archaeon]|nr:hypothetical protein [Candidatus Micrarchaeota archaeon]